jgi:thiamine transport system permease protein
MQEAAAMLGANPLQVFIRVTLPLLMPAISAAAILVFIFTFTSFGVILLLGGLEYSTLEVEIYRQTTAIFNLPTAAALSVIQLAATLILMIGYTALQRRMSQPLALQSARFTARPARSIQVKLWIAVNLLIMALLIFTPIVALVEQSLTFRSEGITTQYYDTLDENVRGSVIFVPPTQAIQNSLEIAALVTVMAVVLGVLVAYTLNTPGWFSRIFDPLFMLPLATSAVTLGFGFFITFDEEPLDLRTEYMVIPIAHTLIAMPFVVRSVLPTLRSIKPSMREAAAMLGANPLIRWLRVDLPLIWRSVLVGATFAFTISMGEFGAATFLNIARPRDPTIPIVISRLLGQASRGDLFYGQALAMSVILMAVCAAGFLLIETLGAEREF